MTLKLSERELEKLLRGGVGRDLQPPAGLLDRLRADLPAELPAYSTESVDRDGEARVLRPAVWWRRPLVSLAATLALVIGASFVAWRSFREVAPSVFELEVAEPVVATAAPEDNRLQKPEAAPLQDEMIRADQLAKSDPPASPTPKIEAAREKTAPQEEVPRRGGGLIEQRASTDASNRALQRALPAEPVASDEVDGVPGGVPGGIVGGIAAPPPVIQPAEVPESTAAEPAAATKAEPMASPKEETKVETFTAATTAGLALRSSAVPERLESPSIESNVNVTESAYLTALRESEERRKTGHLENPALQSDAGRVGRDRASALAAAPRQQAAGAAGFDGKASWEPIERALVAGRWPTAAEVAGARQPKKKGARTEGAKDSFAETKERDAEDSGREDSATALREDLLDFFASENKTPRDLLELRRRALHLAGSEPVDPEVADLVRALNFAARIATPIN